MKVPARSHREYMEFISMNKYPLGRKVEIIPYNMEEVIFMIFQSVEKGNNSYILTDKSS
jgi:hypothetical protein